MLFPGWYLSYDHAVAQVFMKKVVGKSNRNKTCSNIRGYLYEDVLGKDSLEQLLYPALYCQTITACSPTDVTLKLQQVFADTLKAQSIWSRAAPTSCALSSPFFSCPSTGKTQAQTALSQLPCNGGALHRHRAHASHRQAHTSTLRLLWVHLP